MEHIIEMSYDSTSKNVKISSDGKHIIDSKRLNDIDISKWIYPFHINGVNWYGWVNENNIVFY